MEKKEGTARLGDKTLTIVDLPGIYSLSPYSMEEIVARDFIVGEHPDAIINIVDATNLERNLYLTTQLTELGIPVVVAINRFNTDTDAELDAVREVCRACGVRAELSEGFARGGEGVLELARVVAALSEGISAARRTIFPSRTATSSRAKVRVSGS